MVLFKNKDEYVAHFRGNAKNATIEMKGVEIYIEKQVEKLDRLIDQISTENFWEIFPAILGVDAKLVLVLELIKFDDFSTAEIIQLAEKDYRSYTKELCGFDLKTNDKPSMIFNVL